MNLPALHEPRSRFPLRLGDEDETPGDDGLTLRFLLAMLGRRREVLVATLVVAVAAALVWTLALPRIYRASADVVMITRGTDVAPDAAERHTPVPTRTEDVETRIAFIRSRTMAGQVLDLTGLAGDADFLRDVAQPRSAADNLLSWLGQRRAGPVPAALPAADLRVLAVSYLIERLTVERIGDSFTLRIAVADCDPVRAARLANAYARLFTTDDAREQARTSALAAQVLQVRVDELRRTANAAYGAVQGYRVRNGLLSSAATGLTEQEISIYNQQIAAARAEAARDAAALASARGQLRAGGADNVGEAASSPAVAALRGQRAQLAVRERDLAQRYFDDNPDLATVRGQIADLDRQTAAEVGRSVRALETQAQASAQRLSSLLASRSGTRAQLGADNGALVALADLEKRADAAQSLYQSYLQRYNEVVAGSGTEQPSARLVSAAHAPRLPESPSLALNLALGAVVGLLLGSLLAIARELSFRGLTTLDDVEARLGLRGLGFVPACRSVQPNAGTPLDTMRDYPDGGFSEALRNVIVSVRQAPPGSVAGRARVIAVTSAVPGEGKSTVAACIGRALAMGGERTVLVDCDVIRGHLGTTFGLSGKEPGLHEALEAGANADGGAVPRYADPASDLSIVPIGCGIARGERLTERGRLQRVVAQLREGFDTVILDCPPVLPIAEAREIVALADSAVLVVHWRRTGDRMIRAALRLLPARVMPGLGVVLNMVDLRRQARFGGQDAASFYARYEGYYA